MKKLIKFLTAKSTIMRHTYFFIKKLNDFIHSIFELYLYVKNLKKN